MKTTLLVMTLNEIDGMKAVMPQIDHKWFDQIIIVDGGSNDGTVEWAKKNGYEVYIQKRKGIRYAYFEVMPMVRGDIILTFSPDGNSIASAIPMLIKEIKKGNDLVIGSRYLPNAGSEDDDWITAFGNWLFTKTVNFLYCSKYTDVMVMLRAYRTSLIYELDLLNEQAYTLPEKLFFTKISWEPLMSVRAAKEKKRIAEIPAEEPPRIGGERKLQIWRWGAAYYFQFWAERFIWLGGKPKKNNQKK